MTLKSKTKFIMPRTDEIKDPAVKKALDDLFIQLRDLYFDLYDDLKALETRIEALEP